MSRIAGLALWLVASSVSAADAPPPPPPECENGVGQPVQAVPVDRFLETLGIDIHIDQGYPASSYVEPLRYLGLSQIRDGHRNVEAMIDVARKTGMKLTMIAFGDLDPYFAAVHEARNAGVLTAIEGPNEPNNFLLRYNGREGGRGKGWGVVAEYQRDLYARAKADPLLKDIPVFNVSETGAETENVGLQFLTIPDDAGTSMPDGTRYADYANVHNYASPPGGGFGPNQTWQAADPVLRGRWDSLAANHGRTWFKGFAGYDNAALANLPRVTTETGWVTTGDAASERLQASILVNAYLAQFARGWRYTFLYQLRDDEGGLGKHGLYAGARPKLSADAIHALTTILRAGGGTQGPYNGALGTTVETVHALGFVGKDGGRIMVVWNETTGASASVSLDLGDASALQVYDVSRGVDPVETRPVASRHCLSVGVNALILKW